MKKLRLIPLLLASFSIFAGCTQQPVQAADSLLKNGDFEAPSQAVTAPTNPKAKIEGEVGQDWRDESGWAAVSISYSQDTAQKHGGASAQRIEVRSIDEGSVQFAQEVPLKANHTYRAVAWVRAASQMAATFMLRKSGTPYTAYSAADLQLSPEWTRVEVTGRVSETDNGLVMFLPKAVGTYWIDDVVLEDVTAEFGDQMLSNGALEAPYQPVTHSATDKAKLEGAVAQGWRDESSWADVSAIYAPDTAEKHGGEAAQRIEVRSITAGAVQFVQEKPVKAGHIYRASAWMRAADNRRVSFLLRRSGTPYNIYGTVDVQLTPEWKLVEFSARATDEDNGLLMFVPSEPGTYWIDDAKLLDVTDGAGLDATPNTAANAVSLKNGGFESTYEKVPVSTNPKAKIGGEVAPSWRDDSSWAEVDVDYRRDENHAYKGVASQRVDVHSIGMGMVQMVQNVRVTAGRIYHISAYIRAATNAHVIMQLRMNGAPYNLYSHTNVAVTPEWRYFEAYARVPESTDAMILLAPTEAGTYWFDEVAIEDVTQSLAAPGQTRTGNLFTEGSFEAGQSNGWHLKVSAFDNYVRWAPNDPKDIQARVDTTTAAEGKKSLTVTLPAYSVGILASPQIPAKFGRNYSASIALKADRPTNVQLVLEGTSAQQIVPVTTEWKRYSISGANLLGTKVRFRALCIVRETDTPVTFWLDGAMLEEKADASDAYQESLPVELGLGVPRPGSIIFDAEPAPIEVRAAAVNGDALPTGAKLKWSVENLAGRVTNLPTIALPTRTLSIAPDAAAPRGVFKIRAQVLDAGGKPLSDEVEKIFARLPHPRELTEQESQNSFFGAHVELQQEKLSIARAVGARWIRLHYHQVSTQWPIVEPKPGEWNWNEEGIRMARANGLHILGMLDGAPRWASKNPQAEFGFFQGWNLPDAPGALDKWDEYIRRTVVHYKPWISHWEVWNEPYQNMTNGEGFFPNGTPEQYAELLKRASIAARAANPDVTLVGVCSPAGDAPEWLDRVLKIAGPGYFDAMSFHGYNNRLQGGQKTHIGSIIDSLIGAEARYGQAKPLWNSEGGPNDNVSWYTNETSAMRYQMAMLVRLDVAQLARGVQKFFPYTMHGDPDHGEGDLSMMEYDRAIKPAVASRAVLASLVDGAKYISRTEPVIGAEAHEFRQKNGQVVRVVWSYDQKPHTVTMPPGFKALDVLGNPLSGKTVKVTDEPLYFVKG